MIRHPHLLPCLLLAAFVCSTARSAHLFVAPGGSDTNPGTQEKPFATLEKARDAVRELKHGTALPADGVTIYLRGGEYSRTTPLVLAPEDSGEPGKPIVYKAYRDEKPVLSGGRRITGFKPGPDGVWQAAIPEAKDGRWVFRTLYVNGSRYTLARSPNRGYYRMAGAVPDADSPKTGRDAGKSKTAFRTPAGAIQPWPDLASVNLKVWNRWWTSLLTLKHVDPQTGIVQLAGPTRRVLPNNHLSPFIVENHPGALDAPGEWQLDRKTGVLRIIPRTGDDLSKAQIIAPVAEKLLILAGNLGEHRPVEHVQFRGITFRCSTWTLPPEGLDDVQAAAAVGAAIEATGARHCVIEACEVTQTDSYAVWLHSGCRDCTVRRCHLHDLGAGGVKIGEMLSEPPEVCAAGNCVENCFIHNAGHVHGSGVGVWIGACSDNVVAHNEICDLWYTGVSVGWKWGTMLNGTRNNRITHNHIHHVMQRLDDGGGIYSLGLQPQTVLGNNHIHDVGRCGVRGKGHGIYLDEGSAGVLVENNLIHDTQWGVVRLQVGTSCNIITNNICAFGGAFQIDMEVARTNIVVNNIIYWEHAKLFRYDKWPNYEKFISQNVYWRTDGEPILFAGHTWDEWRQIRQTPTGFYKGATMDHGSVIADPQFVDPARRDFHLKPTSPAYARGFQPIDIDSIGLSGDEAWRTLPSRSRVEIPLEDDPGLAFVEDFEQLPLGAKPTYAEILEDPDVPGAVMAVSDEHAASGRKSLKLVDLPRQKAGYTPYFIVSPQVPSGLEVVAFDLLLQAGSQFRTEWRDNGSPAGMRVGPKLEIDAKRQVVVSGKPIEGVRLPENEWLHVEMRCRLGVAKAKTWQLSLTSKNGNPLTVESLPCDEGFEILDWLCFMSAGTSAGVLYLDNLSLRPEK